jgi:hypothetical protein
VQIYERLSQVYQLYGGALTVFFSLFFIFHQIFHPPKTPVSVLNLTILKNLLNALRASHSDVKLFSRYIFI